MPLNCNFQELLARYQCHASQWAQLYTPLHDFCALRRMAKGFPQDSRIHPLIHQLRGFIGRPFIQQPPTIIPRPSATEFPTSKAYFWGGQRVRSLTGQARLPWTHSRQFREHHFPRRLEHILVDAPPRENPEEEGPIVEEDIPASKMVKKRSMTLDRWFLDALTSEGQASFHATAQHTTPPAPKQQRKRQKGADGAVVQETTPPAS